MLAGCYHAPDFACEVACDVTAPQCPPGLTCGGNGVCKPMGADDCPAITPDGGSDDVGPDADVAGQVCYGDGMLRVCVEPFNVTKNIVTSTVMELHTGTPGDCDQLQPQTAGPTVCVIVTRRFVISSGGSVRILGNRPVAILALDELSILQGGTLDVASSLNGDGNAGAGADAAMSLCNVAAPGTKATAQSGAAGGGAGGSLRTAGGQGGSSSSGSGGGPLTPAVAVSSVRGGCPGGSGGSDANGAGAGGGGHGGGAVYLLGNNLIAIGGVINASGSGGAKAGAKAGGGGGGSGGLIGLDAKQYVIGPQATLIALGGGGAPGGGSMQGGAGGSEATLVSDATTTPGNSDGGGAGGGAPSDNAGGAGGIGTTGGAGGGGGGGTGYIGVANFGTFSPDMNARIRPTPIPMITPSALRP